MSQLFLVEDIRLLQTQLNGTIPSGFYQMHELTKLDLYESFLSGTIASDIGHLRNLKYLRLRDCEFSGTIPTEVGRLRFLEQVWFDGNDFTGAVPDEICSLRTPVGSETGLSELIADCALIDMVEPPEIECPCCTVCCDGKNEFSCFRNLI